MTEGLPGVSRTALLVAELRAEESARADRLFDDPLAAAFVTTAAASGASIPPEAVLPPGAVDFAAIRTRFFDEQALAMTGAGIRQVVLLAAGLDGRAFRLAWPDGVRLFELDLPELFAFKEPVVAASGATARCGRAVVPVDLRGDWTPALVAAGLRPSEATGWLAEGLLPYLTTTESDRLLAAVTGRSAPGSRLVFDHFGSAASDRPAMRATAAAVRRLGAAFASTVDTPEEWLAEHGWRAGIFGIPALGERYGRALPPDVDMPAVNATALTSAVR
jgi:methyltransferase (TIGR00027 family)